MWWDQCRYLNRYTPYEARERSVKRSHKDSSQARKGQELPALLWEWTGFHSPHTGASPPFPLHPECYPQEKAAFGADHSGCSLSHRIHGRETMRSGKRRYQSAESICNGGSTPKKARRSLPRDLEEPNKSKAKHHEQEHRCLLDTDLPVVQSDTQPCRYQKKRHSENFGTEPGLHSPKTTSCETVDDVWRPQGSSLLADGLPVEGFGLFQMEKKPLKLDSRTDRYQYGQGD
ncbi:ubiquitin carboxyl-terminal hydrolase 42-like [Cavia porcellus]|uniref:ubiquitin carboxyl-terminal hydrolase 42-like n=1 Tax=Cavia porcellus TaxID=10141 RepID=UPI002FE37AA0